VSFGEKRRLISGTVVDTDLKLKREDELHIYDTYRADLQTQQEPLHLKQKDGKQGGIYISQTKPSL